ncbi:MAG: MAPEG family protein [Deltaproteobacteria bacterium]|jgi:uncharacterized membrane protein YecN with MAPEG domain|nr:MAPEG family protein [Deltaproteobacteria bacterium]MBW2415862.1 MAPEG family protein [Deltaproteobacteria bacterium]
MSVAILCTALLGLLVFGLGMAVSIQRGQTNTLFGANPDPADRMYRLIRAHGNATEFAPMLAVLILYLGAQGAGTWVVWTMVIVTACRYLHVAGMLMGPSLEQVQPLRFVGALGTYLGGLALCVALFMTG